MLVPAPSVQLTRAQRLVVLVICSMSLLIVGLDVTIVNVALPAIRSSLHASVTGLQWTIDAYSLVIASLLMLAGSTADRVGRKRTFQTGLAVFSLGSLLCALAPNLDLLIAFRAMQAVGGSMMNPVAMSIIRNVFEDPRERAQAIGIWGAMFGLSIALGPVVGGALVDSVGWRSVFLVNLPVGLAAIALTAAYVPESKADRPRRLDPVGQVLVIVALASLTYAMIEAPRLGWGSTEIVSLLVLSFCAFGGLIGYELRRFQPLLEMRFFASAPFSGASAIAVAAFAAQGGFLFLNTLYLQDVRGLSPFHAGLYLLPMAAMMLICAPVSGRLVGLGHARWPMVGGALSLIAGALMLTQLARSTPPAYLLGAYFLFGLGMGQLNPPITNTAVSGMPPSQAGVAASVASTSRQVGVTLGVAAIGSIAGAGVTGRLGPGFATATHAAWWTVVGLGVLILGLAILSTTAWAKRSARRTAERFREERGPEPGVDPGGGPSHAGVLEGV
jgi:EmrB/QacA subfamily drug resistance transporter